MKTFFLMVLVSVLTFASLDADAARRLGGGKSVGKQSNNVTQREATPPAAPGTPQAAPNSAAKAAPAAGAAGTAAATKRPWGAMLGGLAAGLGLAWLASSLGLGEAFGQIIMFALLAMVVMAVIGYFMRRRAQGNSGNGGLAYQGAGGSGSPKDFSQSHYNPANVGNDASARPWERNTTAFEASPQTPATGATGRSTGSIIGSALRGSPSWSVPEGFDTDGFLSAAKRNFVTLQDAWDRSDISTLRSMMTDDMVGEIKSQLAERETHTDGQPNKTDVVMLEAQLLGIEELGDGYLASVEFSGMIREQPSAGPSPFREVWNMTKPKSGSAGWLVAGVQALQ